MPTPGQLPFDPLERAGELWEQHVGDATSMRLATSIMRVQQILSQRLDAALKPYGITFARFEVLRLLSFSREGRLPLSKIGERLMVHPTSVTNLIDRLGSQGLVARQVDPTDRRRTFASLTDDGRSVLDDATTALMDIDFAVHGLGHDEQEQAYRLLRGLRAADFED